MLEFGPATGDLFAAGNTDSTNIPGTSGAAQPSRGGSSDGFAARLDPTLATLVRATYVGGSNNETLYGGAIAFTPAGDLYLAGGTGSTDLPSTSGGAQPAHGGGAEDGFAVLLSAALTGCVPPSITAQPQSQTVITGSSATLSVSATGDAPLSYQWYELNGATSTPVGGDSPTFSTPPLTASTQFWVRVSNVCGTADSSVATISVASACIPPAVTKQPASQTISSGQSATLVVESAGTSLSYMWYQGSSGDTSSPIAGAILPSYTTPPLNSTTTYWVRITNTCGTVDSVTATVSLSGGGCPTCPVIKSIKSRSSKPGSQAKIMGTRFSTVMSQDLVYFGKRKAKLTRASATALTVIIPRKAKGTVDVFARVNGQESNHLSFQLK